MATIKQILNNVFAPAKASAASFAAPKTTVNPLASYNPAPAAAIKSSYNPAPATAVKTVASTAKVVSPTAKAPASTLNYSPAKSAITPSSFPVGSPNYSPIGGIGTQSGAYTYTADGWRQNMSPSPDVKVNTQKSVPGVGGSTSYANDTTSYGGGGTEVAGASYVQPSYGYAAPALAPMSSSSFSAGGTTSIPSAKAAGGILGATSGDLLGGNYGYEKTPYERQQEEAMRLQAEYYNKLANDQTTEESARNDALRLMQAENNAVERIFADKLASQRQVGNQRLAMDRAINFNAGGTGSSFANASQSRAMDVNLSDEAQIENQKLAALQAINSKAIQMGNQMFADKQNAKKLGVDAYLQAVNNQGTLIEANTAKVATGMINSGIDITTIPKEQIQSIASNLGTTPQRLIDTYNTAKSSVIVNKNIPASAQEYEYAKSGGYTGSFIDYQNEDANRKTAIVRAGATPATGISDQSQALAEQVAAGLMTIKEVPAALRSQVAMAMNSPVLLQKKSDELQSYVNIVDELLANPARRKITGTIDQFIGGNIGEKAKLAKNQYEQIKNIVSLSGREKLKGTGTITDFEAKQLEKAGSAIGRNLGEKDFDIQLKKIKDILNASKSRSVLTGGVADFNNQGGTQQGGGWGLSKEGGLIIN